MSKSKKIIIMIISILTICVIGIIIFKKSYQPSYEEQLRNFAQACESERKMEKYLKKNCDFKMMYAIRHSSNMNTLKEVYKNVKKDDCKKEFEKTLDFCKDSISKDKNVEIIKIENVVEYGEIFEKPVYSGDILLRIDGKEEHLVLYFYDGKIIEIKKLSPMPDVLGNIIGSEEQDEKNNRDFIYQLSNQYNEKIFINKYGYVLNDVSEKEIGQRQYNWSYMRLTDMTIDKHFSESDYRIESKAINFANEICKELENKRLSFSIIYFGKDNIELHLNDLKVVYLKDIQNLNTKFNNICNVVEQNKSKSGYIYLKNDDSAYFKEN